MKLWLDDERDPTTPTVQRMFGAHGDEVWVKTADEAIHMLRTRPVTAISFDHDLGEGKSGYEVAKFIEAAAYHATMGRIEWAVHSANAVGRANIVAAMKKAEEYWG